jgi:hypothetical protein
MLCLLLPVASHTLHCLVKKLSYVIVYMLQWICPSACVFVCHSSRDGGGDRRDSSCNWRIVCYRCQKLLLSLSSWQLCRTSGTSRRCSHNFSMKPGAPCLGNESNTLV